MTVDFLVTLSREFGGSREMAISVKLVESLEEPREQRRTLEKEEIARRYWERRGVPFRFVTDRELPKVLIENLSLVVHFASLDDYGVKEDELPDLLGFGEVVHRELLPEVDDLIAPLQQQSARELGRAEVRVHPPGLLAGNPEGRRPAAEALRGAPGPVVLPRALSVAFFAPARDAAWSASYSWHRFPPSEDLSGTQNRR